MLSLLSLTLADGSWICTGFAWTTSWLPITELAGDVCSTHYPRTSTGVHTSFLCLDDEEFNFTFNPTYKSRSYCMDSFDRIRDTTGTTRLRFIHSDLVQEVLQARVDPTKLDSQNQNTVLSHILYFEIWNEHYHVKSCRHAPMPCQLLLSLCT
jgi:hypothetical protein